MPVASSKRAKNARRRGAFFSEVPKLSALTIPYVSCERRGFKSNKLHDDFDFCYLESTSKDEPIKTNESGSSVNGFSSPKRLRDFRQMGPDHESSRYLSWLIDKVTNDFSVLRVV